MKTLIFASNNVHKLSEIRNLLNNIIEIQSLKDINLEGDIPETSDTLEGNATQKAEWIHSRIGQDCFADDTGLEVEALDGAPGVYSARYAGEGCSFTDNVNKLLKAMNGKTNRKARFRTVICLIENNEKALPSRYCIDYFRLYQKPGVGKIWTDYNVKYTYSERD